MFTVPCTIVTRVHKRHTGAVFLLVTTETEDRGGANGQKSVTYFLRKWTEKTTDLTTRTR